MEILMRAEQAFVLLYERLPGPDDRGDPEGRRKSVLWLKAHREDFGVHCRGMVLMCEDVSALQPMLAPLEKAYRVPARAAATADEAQAHVQQLMAA